MQRDLWEPRESVPVGHGSPRRGWVVTVKLCWSRLIAGALVFSKEAPDILWGIGRCPERIGALPGKLFWDRAGAIAAGGWPSDEFAAFCGQRGVGWIILDRGDAQAKGALERSVYPLELFCRAAGSRAPRTSSCSRWLVRSCQPACASHDPRGPAERLMAAARADATAA